MKRLAKICTFLILIICGVVFAACGESGKTPVLTPSASSVDLVIGTDESKSFDIVVSDYANGEDSVVVESYEQDRIIGIEKQKVAEGKTRIVLTPLYPGKATIKISSLTHGAKPVEVSVNVILPVGDIELDASVNNKLYVIKGQAINFEQLNLINYYPIATENENLKDAKTNQEGVNYFIEGETAGVAIENGVLSVDGNCALNEVSIKAVSIHNENIFETFKVKILNQISASVYVEGELIYQNGNLQEGKNSAFDLFPRESDITKSKEVLLQVVAGAEEDAIKVEKIFDETKFSVELKNYIYENGTFKYTYVVTALNSGYLDNVSFNVSYMDYTFAEKGEDYFVESGNLTFASYNQPNAVLVNGNASGANGVDIVVFENVVVLSKATVLEFTLSPVHLPADCNTIRLFATEHKNLPVNFYKLNSTRTGYELVLGYDKDGKRFGEVDDKQNLYYDMPIGTKLYLIKNENFKLDNSTATIYACELNDYKANSGRTTLQMNVEVNPGASSVDKAEITNDGFNVITGANSIITEFEETDIYLAIAPNNFDIGTTSVVQLKNSSLAKVSKLTVVGKDDNYVYVRFTIIPEKLGATKLTVYLCDGYVREFNLKIISSLDDIDVFINSTEKEKLDYNQTLTGSYDNNDVVVEKLAFKNGITIQLDRIASPITAEYILEYAFHDLENSEKISALTIQKMFENASFDKVSSILDANILNTYGIIQALSGQIEGKTLIRVDVKGKMANGEFETNASHTFYFLVEIYKGVENFEISQNTHEVYSYDTLGDKNSNKSITKFTIDLSSKFGAPTYLNSLELYYENANSKLVEFGDNNRCEDIEGLIITRTLNGTVWEFTIQALTSEVQNHIFIAKLVEVDQSKVIGGVIRLIVKPANEIDNIEIVNVNLKDGIYVENFGANAVNFQIYYNIYTKNGKEPLNNRLIFELSQNLKDLKVEIDNDGKLTIPANVGGVGTVLIYPESNYFDAYNGMKNGDIPFVELKITIANGESEETAIRINTQDKISYLKDYPTKHYILAADLSITETVEDFSGGLYGEYQGKIMTLTVKNGAIFNKLTGKVKNLNIVGNVNASGLLANTNEGTIENVNVLAGSTIESDSGYVGGLVGKNLGAISGVVIEATVSGVNAGGIVGNNATETREIDGETKTVTGTIENVVFAGNIFAGNITASGNAGAIAAENAGAISGAKVERWSNNNAAIINSTGTGFVGGIAGVNSGSIEKSYASSYNNKTNDIIAETGKIGGIVGQNAGSVDQCMTNLSLKGTNIGAVVYKTTGAISNVYTLSEVSSSSASAFAASGASNITNAYSTAYYLDGENKTYLAEQTAGANTYCAKSATFENDVQALVNIDNTIWASKEGGLPYLVNANPPAPIDNIEINIAESTDEFLGDKTNLDIVLYYYQLINQVDNEIVKNELNNKNLINLFNIFGENDLIFENLSSNSLKIVGNNLMISGVGKTTIRVNSKYATPDCQAKEIDFYVIYPVQDFNIYRGASSLNPSTIVKDEALEDVELSGSKLYNSNVKTTVLLGNSNYEIYTNLLAVGFNVQYLSVDGEGNSTKVDADKVIVGVNSIYDNAANGTFDDEFTFVADGTFKVQPDKFGTFENDKNPILELDAILALQNKEIGNYLGNITEISDFDVINALISNKFNKNFEIKVVRGATRIQSTLTESELTPSNVLTFEVELSTDKLNVNNDELIIEIVDKATGEKADNVFAYSADLMNSTTSPYLYKVVISVKDEARKVAELKEYVIKVSDADNKVSLSLDLVLIPQEVENISYSHYPVETENKNGAFKSEVIPTTVLKPGKNGVLALNLYPHYAAYDKIEIESAIVGGEYVLFEQLISLGNDNYKSASGTIGYTSEKDTNKLTIHYSDELAEDNGMIYVRTKIIESVADGVNFPITIRVYPKNPENAVKTTSLVLTSETIDKANISINGEKDAVVARGHVLNFQVAVKEDQELNAINVINYQRNINDPLDYIYTVCNLSEYTIENGKKIYNASLIVGLNAETANGENGLEKADGVVEIQTVMNRWINGRLENAYDNAVVRIVDFTVDGIYIQGNDKEDNVFTAPIQIEQELTFEFILSETPTSTSIGANEAIERIENNKKAFLNSLSLADEQGRKYSINSGVSDYYKNIAYNMYYSSSNTKLFNEYGEYRANPNFDLRVEKKDDDKPASATTVLINGLRSGSVGMQIKIGYKLPGLTEEKYITYNFVIRVQIYEDEDFPITINNEEEFLKYMNATSTETGEPANYILMNDIYLKDFTPIPNTEWIESLDGNNKVITIKNFNIGGMLNANANQRLELALFQNIGENTTLKNLTINLFELEDIIINENLVNDVNVAGLFINNYGAVYNCEVVAINMALIREYFKDNVNNFENIASGLNQAYTSSKHADGYGIRVYFDGENLNKLKSDNTTVKIAGLGITNSSNGRITNSRVGSVEFTKVVYDHNTNQNVENTFKNEHISIHGQADIAGFVVENNGLIASSFFSNGNINNVAVSGTASKTAGFVIYNNFDSQITGCYAVGYKKITEQNNKFYTDGGIYSEGIAAAFVYQNAAIISDSYANMLMGGSLSGRIVSGFVYHNELNAEVQRCYSASTITGKLTTRMPFSGNNARGESMQNGTLTNCYYYVQNYETESLLEEKYSTGAYAVSATTVDDELLYGFSFTGASTSSAGSDYDGIWEWNGDITLVSANDIAISVRYLIENYNGVKGAKRLPYIPKYAYGSENNPIIIRSADEFNRVFGQETNLKENAFYAISQYYNKSKGLAFGHYRLVSNINFNELQIIETTKISSSVMSLTTYGDSKIGVFDGNGLIISNIEIALNNSSVGLFSQVINGAIVKNAELTVKQITSGNGTLVGGVAGYLYNSSIVNIDLKPTNIKGDNRSEINGVNIVGGIVGLVKGNSRLSNVSSSISVISSYRGDEVYERTKIEYPNVSYAGGIVGVLDIYKNPGEMTAPELNAQANKLKVYGEAIIIEGYYVGGVIGYLGTSTYAADLLFEITGGLSSSFEQKISSTGTTVGGIVGVNLGNISEARIEHEKDVQTAIEEGIYNNYNGSASRGGHSSLFEDASKTDTTVAFAGGIVGHMKNGNIENSYSKVDVVINANYAGGIIGKNESNGQLIEVYAFGDVDGKVSGGLIGLSTAEIKLERVVAINYYSKNNSHIATATDLINKINSLNKTQGQLAFNNSDLLITYTYEYDKNLNIVLTFTTITASIKKEDVYVIQTAEIDLNNNGVNDTIAKIENEYFVCLDDQCYAFEDNNDVNEKYDKSFKVSDSSTLYQEGGMIYKKYEGGKVEEEITNFEDKYYLSKIEVKDSEIVYETTAIDKNAKITSLNLNRFGYIVGEQGETNNRIIIGDEVFANKDLSISGKTFNFVGKQGKIDRDPENNANILVNDLIKPLEEYQGAAKDGILINRMFLSAKNGWDPNVWGKEDDDMLPYLTFGILSKVLYIEKPKDFLRLWKYSGQDYMVVIGDDPATAFDPYRYDETDVRTYGEFSDSDLDGLTLDDAGNLHFDLSGISNLFVPRNFSGTLYGEFAGREYVIGGLGDKPLFKELDSAVIRNIGFGGKNTETIDQNSTVYMAEKINSSTVENITVQNAIVNSKPTINGLAGALCYEITGIETIKNFTFNNVVMNVAGENAANIDLSAGLLAGQMDAKIFENVVFTNCALNINSAFKSVNAGMFGKTTATEQVVFTGCKIEGGNINANADIQEHAYIGGFIGNVNHASIENSEKVDAVQGLTIDFSKVETAEVVAGLMFGEAKEITIKNVNLTGKITNKSQNATNNYVVAQIGGIAGLASGTISESAGNVEIDVNVITKTENSQSFISAIGGFVGKLNGKTTLENNQIKNKINVNNDQTSTDPTVDYTLPVIVGGVVGFAQNELEITGLTVLEFEDDESTEEVSITVDSGAHVNKVGGVVGFMQRENLTISGTINVNADISASGKQIVIGGIVGEIDLGSEDDEDQVLKKATVAGTYSGNVNILEKNAATITVGGIVGQILENSNDTENVSEISNAIFDGNLVINPVEDSSGNITKISAGGILGSANNSIVGSANNSAVSKTIVSGNIQIDKLNQTVATIEIGGVVGGVAGGSVLSTKSWGNIMLKDGVSVDNLYIGGVVGSASGTWTFTGNKTLTSIYNKNLASENKLNNVRALVGFNSGTITANGNKYSHMVNLAVDNTDLGANVAYSDLSKEFEGTGTKLKPNTISGNCGDTSITEANAWEIVYYQSTGNVLPSGITIPANAHLIGNGYTWSANTTPINTNNGYVSGFKFKLANVGQNQNTEGIVGTNNGVIYANSVVIYGGAEGQGQFANGETSKGSINSGVAGTNSGSGLIMDTGALLYVNNATAGFVANNAGTILNSYVNGVVHNGATYSFNGGATGRVENCYTTIRNNNKTDDSAIFSGNVEKCFYDKYGTEKTQTKDGVNELTTNGNNGIGGMAAVKAADGTSTKTSVIGELNKNTLDIFTQDYTINFGYPTLMGGAYTDCEYMEFETGRASATDSLQIPNVGKLEQINSLGSKFQIITHIDYAKNNLTSHSSAEIESIIFEGNNYKINNIPSGTNGFFTNITNGRVQNIEFNYLTGATIKGGQYAGAIANTAENIEFNNVRSSGATVSGKYHVGGLVGSLIATGGSGTTEIDTQINGSNDFCSSNVEGAVGTCEVTYYNTIYKITFISYPKSGAVTVEDRCVFTYKIELDDKSYNYYNTDKVSKGYFSNGKDFKINDNLTLTITINGIAPGATVKFKFSAKYDASMENCFNFNDVSGSGIATGGLVGNAEGVKFGGDETENRIGNYGNISSNYANSGNAGYVGGIVADLNGGSMKYAFNIGNVSISDSCSGRAGGIAGKVQNGATTSFLYNYGQVTASGSSGKAGGIIGWVESDDHTNVINFGIISGSTSGKPGNNEFGNVPEGYNAVVAMSPSNGNAHALDWTSQTLTQPTTQNGTVLIETAEELACVSKNIADYSNANIELANDIDLTGYIWNPIGSASEFYTLDYSSEDKIFSTSIGGITYRLTFIENEESIVYVVSSGVLFNNYKIYGSGTIDKDSDGNYKKHFATGISFNAGNFLLNIIINDFTKAANAKFEAIYSIKNFHGKDKTITGMAAFHTERSGLFENIHNYRTGQINIENVRIINSVSQSLGHAGILAGQVAGGGNYVKIQNNTLENCRVYGGALVGAIVGRAGVVAGDGEIKVEFINNNCTSTIGGADNSTLPLAISGDGVPIYETNTTFIQENISPTQADLRRIKYTSYYAGIEYTLEIEEHDELKGSYTAWFKKDGSSIREDSIRNVAYFAQGITYTINDFLEVEITISDFVSNSIAKFEFIYV